MARGLLKPDAYGRSRSGACAMSCNAIAPPAPRQMSAAIARLTRIRPIIVNGLTLMTRPLCIALASLILAACGGSPPPPPDGSDTVTGDERFGWDQPAADAGELASFRYALYVDDVRSEAADVSCTPGQVSGRFTCTARLPALASGTHSLQVAAYVLDGDATRESTRSAIVRVVKR